MKYLAAAIAALALGLSLGISGARAEPTGTELFFDQPYLQKVLPGTRIAYVYRHVTAEEKLGESFNETMELKVDADPQDGAKRIADVDIMRGTQHREAGPFPTMNGNPISLVLLERDVREMAALSKGSPFYLRNRVKDGLVAGKVEETRVDYDGRSIAAWKLTMTPFATDPNKDKLLELAGRRYEFVFADEVPGGIYAIRVITPQADGKANMIETSLTLTGSTPPAVVPATTSDAPK